ncbi:MAG: hypothetical protein HY545_02930 [Candidatus Doudnabacteria bacterium]|nr:hypothetical protein [Candidatus Doudnabacteria bacterium]
MRPGTMEDRYIQRLEKPSEAEIEERAFLAENLAIDILNQKTSALDARLSTREEDSGIADIQTHPKIDAVSYLKGKTRKPAIALQITMAEDDRLLAEKMREVALRPFVSVEGKSIPKAFVAYKRNQVETYSQDHDLAHHPELAIYTLDRIIKSLQFSLTQTKNLQEQQAIKDLIQMLEDDKRKLIS